MPSAGDLRGRIHFQRREVVDDGFGNEVSGQFETQFTVAAGFKPLRGTEAVQASRLEGVQPSVVTVRQSHQTRQVTPEWRMVDARNPERIFNISAISDPDQKRQWFEILGKEGVAT